MYMGISWKAGIGWWMSAAADDDGWNAFPPQPASRTRFPRAQPLPSRGYDIAICLDLPVLCRPLRRHDDARRPFGPSNSTSMPACPREDTEVLRMGLPGRYDSRKREPDRAGDATPNPITGRHGQIRRCGWGFSSTWVTFSVRFIARIEAVQGIEVGGPGRWKQHYCRISPGSGLTTGCNQRKTKEAAAVDYCDGPRVMARLSGCLGSASRTLMLDYAVTDDGRHEQREAATPLSSLASNGRGVLTGKGEMDRAILYVTSLGFESHETTRKLWGLEQWSWRRERVNRWMLTPLAIRFLKISSGQGQ
ncbi:hypothetical protein B0I35DRAFT_146441 [Stachybotrys elegans]|uniref:Uncharacterized protein n=1 Tax=Stachybotrys elegans TaxID=80388 RepID=A0A8K0SAR2_9HYPO|nr:hypothetical protein B0I35DRAFT_146441 [Stachybotrys elegans]